MKQNWKTTSAGIAAILVAVGSALPTFTPTPGVPYRVFI
jgi:hypothetical protein